MSEDKKPKLEIDSLFKAKPGRILDFEDLLKQLDFTDDDVLLIEGQRYTLAEFIAKFSARPAVVAPAQVKSKQGPKPGALLKALGEAQKSLNTTPEAKQIEIDRLIIEWPGHAKYIRKQL